MMETTKGARRRRGRMNNSRNILFLVAVAGVAAVALMSSPSVNGFVVPTSSHRTASSVVSNVCSHNTRTHTRTRTRSPLFAIQENNCNNNSDDDDDDDDENPIHPERFSKRRYLLHKLSRLVGRKDKRSSRRRVKKRHVAILALSLLTSTLPSPKPAHAKYSHELYQNKVYSIRPGTTQKQAQELQEGKMPEDVRVEDNVGSQRLKAPYLTTEEKARQQEAAKASAKAKAKNKLDYGDEDSEEDADDDILFGYDDEATLDPVNAGRLAPRMNGRGNVDTEITTNVKSTFTGATNTKSRSMYIKVSIGLFIPTWGAMFTRETFRRRRERRNVKKGLEIMEAQRAEYFGVNETATDSEIEDELKDLKDSEDEEDEEDDDEDDDDEDDDDDDDEPPPSSSRKGGSGKPKKPSGGGGSGGGPSTGSGGDGGSTGTGGGSGGDPGYGKASDDDIKKLGDLFNKS